MTDGSVKHHIRVSAENSIQARQTVVLTITSEFETTKVRNNEISKQNKYEIMEVETTKVRNNEISKQRKSEIAKQGDGERKTMKGRDETAKGRCETNEWAEVRDYETTKGRYETTKGLCGRVRF